MKKELQLEIVWWINISVRIAGYIVIGLYTWDWIKDPTIILVIFLFIMLDTRMAKDFLEKENK